MRTTGIVSILFVCLSAHAAQLPFVESFDELAAGSLHTQNDWNVLQGTATVQTNTAHEGKAVELEYASITHALSTDRRNWNNSKTLPKHSGKTIDLNPLGAYDFPYLK